MGLGVAAHLLDVILGETAGVGDGDLLLVAGGLVLGRDVHDAVGVDIERDLDLGHAAGRRRDAGELELAEGLVVGRHLALALEDVDFDRGLAVGGRGEDLGLGGRDGGVALDQLGGHAAQGLDAQRERGHVEKQHVLDLTAEDAGLDGGAEGDGLIGVDRLVRLLAEELADGVLHRGDAGRAADEDDLVDVGGLEVRVGHGLTGGPHGGLDEIGGHLLELGARERHVEVLGTGLVGGDEGQVDIGGHDRAELDLGLLGSFLEALEGHAVLGEVDALFLLELGDQPGDDALVEVVTAEVGVTGRGLDFEDAVAQLEDRDVEGAAAEVVDQDGVVMGLVLTVGERGGGGLVDDAQDFEAGDGAGVLGGLALLVVEVRRNRDDGLGDLLAEVGLGVGLQLAEDHRGDFLGRVILAGDLNRNAAARGLLDLVGHLRLGFLDLGFVELVADEALDRVDGVLGVGDGLTLGDLPDQTLAGLGEPDDRRGQTGPLSIRDDGGLTPLHHRDDRVGGAQVDPDDLTHCAPPC
ncbi:NAD-specific glutamate dehydrogenase [compost metagenome]